MTLTASPKLDLRVAQKCGFREPHIIRGPAIPDGRCFRMMPDDETKCVPPLPKEFRPSTDLNDAFLAAEKVWLFDKDDCVPALGKDDTGMWRMIDVGWRSIAEPQSSPALCLCAAILRDEA